MGPLICFLACWSMVILPVPTAMLTCSRPFFTSIDEGGGNSDIRLPLGPARQVQAAGRSVADLRRTPLDSPAGRRDMGTEQPDKRTSVVDIRVRKGGEPLVCLTAYTALTAVLLDEHVDLLLVGDSLGMVLYGLDTTVAVSLDMMIAHGAAVMRGANRACVIVDMPFGSYQESPQAAFRASTRVMKETGAAGVKLEGGTEMAETIVARIATASGLPQPSKSDSRLDQEEIFHDQWAGEVSPEEVRVRESFEAVTAPENRYILSLLGDLGGKRVLDLGCGLGEASVYFATKGALVTACDLSLGMLDITSQVAACHGVSVTLHRGAADRTGLAESSFDIVYSANLLHHVDAAAALDEIHRVLATGGIFVTWDPLGHNPIIDVYRRMAKSVRTLGEQPLRMSDLELFQTRFRDVRWRCFWLLTQAIFIRFYLWEKTHPSKERYWKKILTDAERISKFYQRLESLDHRILNAFPWLGRYCWNILVWGRK